MKTARIRNPVDAVLNEARRWLNVREDPPGSNRGVAIDFFNYQTVRAWQPFPQGVMGAPWCAAFVSTVGRLALGHAWPVDQTVACKLIANWAETNGVLHQHPEAPEVGDLFLLYYASMGRYGHVGFVSEVDGQTIETLEGNTNLGGSREGYGVFARTRPVNEKTAFVRWIDTL